MDLRFFGHLGVATLEGTRPGWRLKKTAREPFGPFSRHFVLGPHNIGDLLAQVRDCQTYRFELNGRGLSLERTARDCQQLIDIVSQGDRYLVWIRRADLETQAAVGQHLAALPGFRAREQASTAGTFVYFQKPTGRGSAA